MNAGQPRIPPLIATTHARIDLSRYEQNIRILRRVAGPDLAFMAVVKANAYGHGSVACAQAAVNAGASYLAVARITEALRLRDAGVDAPILVLGGPDHGMIDRALEHHITLTVGTERSAHAIIAATDGSPIQAKVHRKIDTGLHRYGAAPDLAIRLAAELAASDKVILEGIYAHFSSADEANAAPTTEQISQAISLVETLSDQEISFRYVHLPNSAATLLNRMGPSTLVRCGIATYGLMPSSNVPLPEGVAPVLTLHSTVSRVFDLPVGDGVSYGLTYRATRPERLATVPVGYADGLPRSLSNRGWFVVGGRQCPIRGRVCMDQTVIGVHDDAREGDQVQIVGTGDDGAMTLDRIADVDSTINYEIAARISARVPRVYTRDGEPVAWVDDILGEFGDQ